MKKSMLISSATALLMGSSVLDTNLESDDRVKSAATILESADTIMQLAGGGDIPGDSVKPRPDHKPNQRKVS